MTTPLTLAEAVPLGTVHLQRLLERAGVRSLAIKGPAFVELGVRQNRTSNDIDLLIHPEDRVRGREALIAAGWVGMKAVLPEEINGADFSSTLRHPNFPCTIDLHHGFSGIFDAANGFDALWRDRVEVTIAHQDVVVPCRGDALVIETLNVLKSTSQDQWDVRVSHLPIDAPLVSLDAVLRSASKLEVTFMIAPLINRMGGPLPRGPEPQGLAEWRSSAGRPFPHRVLRYTWKNHPNLLPRVLWLLLMLDEESGHRWAHAWGVTYRNRFQISLVRMVHLLVHRSWRSE